MITVSRSKTAFSITGHAHTGTGPVSSTETYICGMVSSLAYILATNYERAVTDWGPGVMVIDLTKVVHMDLLEQCYGVLKDISCTEGYTDKISIIEQR